MLFNSYVFIFGFLPVILVVYYGLLYGSKVKVGLIWLTVASLFFYAYWKISYLPLLLVSIGFNYALGQEIDRSETGCFRARLLLTFGVFVNLLILGYYKYYNFLFGTFNSVFQVNWSRVDIFLPLAISFYTFTQIAYLVDAYREEIRGLKYDFVTYCLFVCFFPQLVAGPILRHNEIIPQFRQIQNFIFSQENFAIGLTWFILGLSKKVLIADSLSPWVEPIFSQASSVTFLEAWIGVLSYTFQLYFDFSGYSDMAIGLGWMFNINLPINFDSPYKALSIADFWRRWHITLSRFLRDYLYIPLGGSRKGLFRNAVNLMVTMLLGGLWHGAGWNFVVWGGLHGFYLSVHRIWTRLGIVLPKFLAWVITFLSVVIGWVFFRAYSLQEGWEIVKAMLGIKPVILPVAYQVIMGWLAPFGVSFAPWREFPYLVQIGANTSIIILVAILIATVLLPNTQEIIAQFKPNLFWALLIGVLASFCFIFLNQVSEFLYFQF